MSRIEKVMRELSDLRSFYLKLQQSKRTASTDESVMDAVAEAPADYNAEDSGYSFGSDARSCERARLLRQQAAAGGLKFETYLPSGLAEWVLDMVEKGIFRDPGEAVFVYMSQAQDITEVPGLGQMIEGEIIQERIAEAEKPDAKTYTMDEVKAHFEKWSKEQHPAAYWYQLPWPDSRDLKR
jgi:antitoxin ParD1/3/4